MVTSLSLGHVEKTHPQELRHQIIRDHKPAEEPRARVKTRKANTTVPEGGEGQLPCPGLQGFSVILQDSP